jgi:hypothetical protein
LSSSHPWLASVAIIFNRNSQPFAVDMAQRKFSAQACCIEDAMDVVPMPILHTFRQNSGTLNKTLTNISNSILPDDRLGVDHRKYSFCASSDQIKFSGPEPLATPRKISKPHGDLSNIRPKSPVYLPEAGGRHLQIGDYVDDSRNLYSDDYNRPLVVLPSVPASQPAANPIRKQTAGVCYLPRIPQLFLTS